MAWYFTFFFVSGLCSILYELIWLRLSMAEFGVTTALTSIMLSVFMAGLGLGSWLAGALVRKYGSRLSIHPLKLYGLTELLIGVSAIVVPWQLSFGNHLLEAKAAETAMSSAAFYLMSGAWLTLTLLPWCACMGATIPFVMFAIRSTIERESARSFSFLYLANVAGAIAGAALAPVLIELAGFHATLKIGAGLNAAIAFGAIVLASASAYRERETAETKMPVEAPQKDLTSLWLLFLTGLATMGMEVIWIRLFTPYVGPVVYAFATILASYLFATFLGSRIYRKSSLRSAIENRLAWVALVPLGMLPLLTADVRLRMGSSLRVFLGVMPFAAVMGFLTPMLVDRWSAGDPDRAGKAYGVNVLGCIAGPLLSGFLLLPVFGERWAVLLLTVPWILIALRLALSPSGTRVRIAVGGAALAAAVIFFLTQDFATQFPRRVVLRDSTATVIATGAGMGKKLIINGVNITAMVPITKMMAHLTLASLAEPPHNALVICFGMGTTFRSAMSWGIPVTAVDLIPSVPRLFSYYHRDAPELIASPRAHIVIDDGRRYLERTPGEYDAIIIDPPPPVHAAGSSLLYSEDFYAVAKSRLRPGGILHQFLPDGLNAANDNSLKASVTKALRNSFACVRIFQWNGYQGWHFLASDQPIPVRTAADLAARLPASAIPDLLEWGPARSADAEFEILTSREVKPEQMVALAPNIPALQDDRPINEYYAVRTRVHRYAPMLQLYF